MSCRKTHEIRSHRSRSGWVNKNKSICNDKRRQRYEFNKLAKQMGFGSVKLADGTIEERKMREG